MASNTDQPPAKRARVSLNGATTYGSSQKVQKQESFTEVLAKLEQDSVAAEYGSADLEGADGTAAAGGRPVGGHIESSDAWPRPRLPEWNKATDKVFFQQIEIEESNDASSGATLRLFGVTQRGNSVLTHVHGFRPYFYVAAPQGFISNNLQSFKDKLNSSITTGMSAAVLHTALVKKKNLWGYRGDEDVVFIKITCPDQKAIPKVKGAFERGQVDWGGFAGKEILTFESNIQYTLRFMVDTRIVGMNWIEIAAGDYEIRKPNTKVSNCQLEIDVNWKKLHSHPAEGEGANLAPLRILSFDIECAGRKGIFPEASMDPVIQIAAMVTRQGESKPFIRNVFTLNTCSHIVGSQVLEFKDERQLLIKWREFVEIVDPDLMIGYNITNFDLPYLLDRAKALKVMEFPYLGRLKNVRTEVRDTHFSSKAYGNRDNKSVVMEGRLQMDLLQVVQRDYKLRSYTLNAVCAQFLGEQKEDVHHSIITELQNGTPESRRRLAVYCLKVSIGQRYTRITLANVSCAIEQDAYLPQRLMDKLMCFVNYTEMARVTGVPFNYLLSRGQQIKVISQLYRKAGDEGYLIPALRSEGSDEVQYEGATVIEPNKGYYDVPIATLDFASLYPSIMMAHNLCYTTLIDETMIKTLNLQLGVDYVKTPNNDYFVTASKRQGLLPTVLQDLLGARKRAKADLKKETDPFKRAVLDGRQLALKISANSVYGFTGATIGKLPCLAISSSTTAYGREMIEFTKQQVEQQYTMDNGYSHNAEVIYGDTDSVMVKFGCPDLESAMKMGSEAADFVTTKFVKPIKLEFEKVYFPYLLINKKRYAGLYWTKPDKWDKMDTKGIETVRRDNCRLVSTVIETCLHKMLIERDVQGAESYVKQVIADLLQNKIDMSQLVITKALAKADYAAKQAHVELAERMRKRDAGSAPSLGDRVAYVIIKGMKGAAAYEKSEDPLFVLNNNIPIDTKYYLDNQLSKPLMRIFEPILGEKANSLLAGDHTRTISIATPTIGGLMKFAVKTVTCLGCRTVLRTNKDGAVCANCRPRLGELYQKQVALTSALQVDFARLWTQCQRCQGSLHQDVLCTSADCPIFYRRTARQKEVKQAVEQIQRFHEEKGWGLP
ncbi:DNA-directed DNA polymerase delta [Naganishia vaughanmartiniae]|uniref:DNA-directed DNA polymerase delta n=1 Tax=Naganishia vaughanmartiniae TaxID=1424756 RepID=A0ACC2XEQ7_9TREE|nr:DNA-directed DNA polymerase delta [Naganishia vaughanmartiniae]